MSVDLPRIIQEFGRPTAYPHPAAEVTVHQTHISVVFLAGEFAYKIKKPVELGFVDYGSLERRRHFCREEVRLNRRLAPDVYLGVVPVVERGGELRVVLEHEASGAPSAADGGRSEDVVEWAVRMERLPAHRTLESLVRHEEITGSSLEDVAGHLVRFHADARRGPEISRYGRFEAVAENFRDNFRDSREQVGRTVHREVFHRLSHMAEDALEGRRALIDGRAERDVPCEAHGDLRLDHVYFLPGRDHPVIVDCIEFNEAFRCGDPVADMAFLDMDLRQAGRRDLADRFSRAYFRASGDEEGRRLLDLYVAYRATVRGKVQGIKAAEEEISEEEQEAAARTATGHWLLALGVLAPPEERPALVLVGGLPGTGKSTLARGLADEAGFRVIRSDAVRKELAGLDPEEPADASYGAGLYSEQWSDRTYRACRERAEEVLFAGGRAVVDASFHDEARRRAFLEAGRRHGVRVRFLVCEADPEVVRRRLEERSGDASDADWEVYRGMAARWEEPGETTERITRRIGTEDGVDATLERAMDALRGAGLVD